MAARIAATFNQQPQRHGREYRVCCPVHEADGGVHRPSLAVWDAAPGRGVTKCMTGCSKESVRVALRERGVVVGGGRVSSAQQLQAAKAREVRRVEQLTLAREALMNGSRVSTGSPGAKYLAGRHLWPAPFVTDGLWDIEDPQALGDPALAAVIVDPSTLENAKPDATGLSILSLRRDGSPRLTPDGKKFRSVVGASAGNAVALGTVGASVVIGEGVETVMAAMKILGVHFGLATLSASNLPAVRLPGCVERVYVAIDNDKAGHDAADALYAQIAGTVFVQFNCWHDGPGWDAADELTRRSTS